MCSTHSFCPERFISVRHIVLELNELFDLMRIMLSYTFLCMLGWCLSNCIWEQSLLMLKPFTDKHSTVHSKQHGGCLIIDSTIGLNFFCCWNGRMMRTSWMMNLYPWNFNFVWCFWGIGGCLDFGCSWFVFGVGWCFVLAFSCFFGCYVLVGFLLFLWVWVLGSICRCAIFVISFKD